MRDTEMLMRSWLQWGVYNSVGAEPWYYLEGWELLRSRQISRWRSGFSLVGTYVFLRR